MAIGLEGTDGAHTFKAGVNSEGELKVRSTSISVLEHSAEHDERAFTWTNLTYNYSAGDTILLVKNTSSSRELHITSVIASGDTATQVILHCPASITPAGTSVVGVNLNRKSGKTADAIAMADETANSLGPIIESVFMGVNAAVHTAGEAIIILGTNDQIAVDFVTVGAAALVTIIGYYADA